MAGTTDVINLGSNRVVSSEQVYPILNLLYDESTGLWHTAKSNAGVLRVSDADYTLAYEDTGTYTYIGHAVPGTATSAASWRIKRMTNATLRIVYADGNAGFDNIWDNRASLSYT